MSAILNPYLNFDGNTRAAMEFYASVFGGDLTVSTFADLHMDNLPADGVMHANLTTPMGFTLMASESEPGKLERGNGCSLSISGDDESALTGYFEALSEGGNVTLPMAKQAWGDVFGMVTDQFGIAWMVNVTQA